MKNDNTDIKERIEIRNLIASSSENMLSAKLLIDNFKHIKWHTVFEFWNELVSELELHGALITVKPTPDDITNTTHYEVYKKSYESLNDYGIRFTINDINLFVFNLSEDCIYWGMEKKLLTPKQIEQINQFVAIDKTFFRDNGSHFWRYFGFSSDEEIIFSDFSHNGTYSLINETYRLNLIQKILVSEILTFLKNIK